MSVLQHHSHTNSGARFGMNRFNPLFQYRIKMNPDYEAKLCTSIYALIRVCVCVCACVCVCVCVCVWFVL